MQTVKVQFINFWKGFQEQGYAFLELFQKRYNQQIDGKNPDIQFIADRICHKPKPVVLNPNSVSVFYTGENTPPPAKYDYSFSFEPTTDTNFQMPIFARCKYYFDFLEQHHPNRYQKQPKVQFCNFVYRNQRPQERQRFCKLLQEYKHVDCPGEVLNNMPNFTQRGRKARDWLSDKISFISKYKFTIAFENESSPNYVTEKIFDPLYAGSIPIYWGAPNVTEYFNPKSFINVQDFASFDEVIEFVKEIDTNTDLYQEMRLAPVIHDQSRLKDCTEENILKRFDKIVQSKQKG